MKAKQTISLVVPSYNEADNIFPFYQACAKAFHEYKYQIELVFIDDGSSDRTLAQLEKLLQGKLDPNINIKAISFSRNFGKEAAMFAGLEHATGDFVGVVDADLQQPPRLIKPMVTELEKDKSYDCVCYYQETRRENKLISSLKHQFYKTITKVSEVDFVDGASDFRLFRRYVVDSILSLTERNRFSKGIFSWIGFKTKYLPYIPEERQHGKSSWSTKGLFKYALTGIFSFSTAPLKLATWLGIIFSLVSFIYLIIIIIQRTFFTINIPGYATIVASLMLIGGLVLFSLGIIGEYIARIYIESKARPIYIKKLILDSKSVKNRNAKN